MRKTMKWTMVLLTATLFRCRRAESQAQGINLFRMAGRATPNRTKSTPSPTPTLWFILASKFTGPEARKNANRLVYELRKKYKLPAYMFKYDNQDDDLRKLGDGARSYQYLTAPPEVYAVLIGSFPSSDDPTLQEILTKVKRYRPESLKNSAESRMVVKEFEMLAQSHKEYAGYGPSGKAHAVPNPMIPKEYFGRRGGRFVPGKDQF